MTTVEPAGTVASGSSDGHERDTDEHAPRGERPHHRLVELALDRPKLVIWLSVAVAALSLVGMLRVEVDTDPQNMLPADDEVRVRNDSLREAFGTGPMIVVGIVGAPGDASSPVVLEAVDGGTSVKVADPRSMMPDPAFAELAADAAAKLTTAVDSLGA